MNGGKQALLFTNLTSQGVKPATGPELTALQKVCSSSTSGAGDLADAWQSAATKWMKRVADQGQTMSGYATVLCAISNKPVPPNVAENFASAMKQISESTRQASPAQLPVMRSGLPKLFQGLTSFDPTPFGFTNTNEAGDIRFSRTADVVRPGATDCGPVAITELLGRSQSAQAAARGETTASFDMLSTFRDVKAMAKPTVFGTTPDQLTTTLEHFAREQNLEARHNQFKTSDEALNFTERNVPCIIKLGANITKQHYTVVTEVLHAGSQRVFRTSDHLLIPESSLRETIGTAPAGNSVWTIRRPGLVVPPPPPKQQAPANTLPGGNS